MIELPLDKIRIDGATQSRVKLNQGIIDLYAEEPEKLPPGKAVFDGTDYWLYEGFHRFFALKKHESSAMALEIVEGTVSEARWLASGSNKSHAPTGLRRTNADKRKAVEMALEVKWDFSDRAIADHVGISDKTVAEARSSVAEFRNTTTEQESSSGEETSENGESASSGEQESSNGQANQANTRTGKDGRQYKAKKEKKLCEYCKHSKEISRPMRENCEECAALNKKKGGKRKPKPDREAGDDTLSEIVAEKCTPEVKLAVHAGIVTVADAASIADELGQIQNEALDRVRLGKSRNLKAAAKFIRKPPKTTTQDEVKDELGNEVPENCRDIFADPGLKDLVWEIEQATEFVRPEPWFAKARGFSDHYGFMLLDKFQEHSLQALESLQLAVEALKAGLPHAVCPTCGGAETNGKVCKHCRGHKYIPIHRAEEIASGKI